MSNELSNDDKLRRLLYLSTVHGDYYTAGHPLKYSIEYVDKFSPAQEYYANHIDEFFKCLSESEGLPKRPTLFYTIGKFLLDSTITPSDRNEICLSALKLCQNDEDFFDLIMYATKFRREKKTKIPTTLRKTIKRFYTNKTAEDLVKSYIHFKSHHEWSHKNLFKLTHFKSDTPVKNLIVNQIMFKNVQTDTINDENTKKLIQKLRNIDELRTTKDVETAVGLIEELQVDHKQLNPHLQKKAQAWEAVIPNMNIQDILISLPKLYKHGFLKTSKQVTTSIIECLTDPERVKASQIHPIEVFIHQKNFEKGGKPIDPKLYDHLVKEKKLTEEKLAKLREPVEPKCPPIMNAIHKCMAMSYGNVKPTNKKIFITIDVTEKMDNPCIHNKNIPAIEAALSIAMFFVKVEKDVTIATCNDKDIKLFTINKGDHFADILKKLKEQKSTYLLAMSPIDWAIHKKKNFDAFLFFVHTESSKKEKMEELIKKYRETINQNSKFMFYSLATTHINMVSNIPNAIHIVGLDNPVPKLLHAFISGKFC